MNNTLLVYAEKFSPRLDYTLNLIFSGILKVTFSITHNIREFEESAEAKINYSPEKVKSGIRINPCGLLFETGIHPIDIQISQWKNHPCFFQTDQASDVPFDLFAASFFLASRYEEYLPFKTDQYGRFEAIQSLAFKYNFLQVPIVNQWVQELARLINNQYPSFVFPPLKFSFLPTFDIDDAYAYRHKGLLRTAGILAKAVLQGNVKKFENCLKVLASRMPDPFDCYDYMLFFHKQYHLKPLLFFQVGRYGKYDKNISSTNKKFRQLIQKMDLQTETGLHPSFRSADHPELIVKEKAELEKITGQKINRSRQHYLRLSLPDTYRNLIKAGIDKDFTMGYATQAGFRAGICSPFPFYDLQNEETTSLIIFPLVVMDITLKKYQDLNPLQADEAIKILIDKVKAVNGTFVSLWHNETIVTEGPWRQVMEDMYKYITRNNQYFIQKQ
ncbi:MAG: polysaccharide deacetylase family protein [Bacteroidota bacterium]|nr:polysaccharide deacetylase family protein [Bacteroidota bacterium]